MYRISLAFLSLPLTGLMLSGCSAFEDSSLCRYTSPCYNKSWKGGVAPPSVALRADEQTARGIPDSSKQLEAAEIVDIALSNNPSTQITWFQARSNAFLYQSAKGALYPQLNLQERLNYSHFISGSTGGGGEVDVEGGVGIGGSGNSEETQLITDLTLSYLLLDFGGRSAAIEVAKQGLIASDWSHSREIQTVIVNALTAMYNYMSQRALVEARKKDLEDTSKGREASEKQFEAGIVAKKDVLQARSAYVNAQLNLQSQKGLEKIAMAQLATAMGLAADTVLNVAEPPLEPPTDKMSDDLYYFLSVAKAMRPDLQAAYASLVQSWANLKGVWSNGMPTLAAQGLFENVTNFTQSSQNNRLWQGQLVLNAPLFTGFSDYYNTKSARELVNVSWAQYRLVEQSALLDVVTSYYNYETAIANVASSEEYLRYTQEAYDVAYNSYERGVATILDVLQAQAALANARSEIIQARTSLAVSLAGMAYSTGILYR
ncbi:TolC family protein [Estrella lausannensis]|uniref:Type I secretion outer membrane protein n=1 Tax=Estrella lausannensis TaxID=483423 RepID=A0A0H5DPT5_9BACT|nr:TolC family protein [Estrella lausannensis]CRX38492.1 type I secretion outer membrane protein [Estrella lausannensis]